VSETTSEDAVPAHATPFYCPYCGEEDIRPDGEAAGQYLCGACRRAWRLRFVGLVGRSRS
jgi:predicted RNA-binding Zn-ribbon protein involved in translation (DUF1610 family)